MGASDKELCVVFLTNDTSYRCHAMAGKFLVNSWFHCKKTEKKIPAICYRFLPGWISLKPQMFVMD